MTNDLPQMTLQDAITILKRLDNIVNNSCSQAIYMVIKALEQQSCEDCISREAVKDKLMEIWTRYMPMDSDVSLSFVLEKISEFPSVTPQQKIGKWKYTTHHGRRYRVCIACNCEREDDLSTGWNYCPNCGAKMEEIE